jgi:hypothetical protein
MPESNKMISVVMALIFGLAAAGCRKDQDSTRAVEMSAAKPEITQEELSSAVPELSELHEVVYPLWHTAYPEKDYELIRELLPQADKLAAEVGEAELPGILRDKQADWDQGIANLKSTLNALHQAAESDNQPEMIRQVEEFHSAYERLVRIIRPVLPELDAFHQELYKIYHYYAPDFDLENIRATAQVMRAALPALQEAQLPRRLADRQPGFEKAVDDLDAAVEGLMEALQGDDKDPILTAVDNVHTAYQAVERIFD